MADIHLSSNGEASQQKNSIGIFCDIQNVSSIKGKGDLLLKFAQLRGRIDCKKLYYNSRNKDQTAIKNILESLGFLCVDVPDTSPNSADHRLMADCVQLFAPKRSPIPNIIILVLGDWDYAGLISILKALGKKVIIFAQRGSASPKLIKLVGNDNFHFVDELPQLVGNETQPQATVVKSQISYDEAIEYLTEAIKTALHQGKPTVFGYIDKLMRQRCTKYQGASSILTPNCKAFSRFSKFVYAAVKDGKVKMQNQQLFLVELDKLAG
ncbi:NYN domain-containing protein [Calothrix sp. FACHB-1219]|uniref:NYN domain-containing protein n=1 Tax=unclassified Calothrix TaxID=2619626 RepID=UPI001687512C|nr:MULTISPECIES: NYN domain-containing protein [unclassified Calothrix]MBD2204190.1 NYN domain-containing protein [Calothrix sp. FACHB-168]MBD2220496.1 NYN domain-containing protein [Calothrix sp. FACHB-1219]